VVVKSDVVMRDRGCRWGGIVCPRFEVVGSYWRYRGGIGGLRLSAHYRLGSNQYTPFQLTCLGRIRVTSTAECGVGGGDRLLVE
jgi:hypothetical protein